MPPLVAKKGGFNEQRPQSIYIATATLVQMYIQRCPPENGRPHFQKRTLRRVGFIVGCTAKPQKTTLACELSSAAFRRSRCSPYRGSGVCYPLPFQPLYICVEWTFLSSAWPIACSRRTNGVDIVRKTTFEQSGE